MENDVVCGGRYFRSAFARAACDGRDCPQIYHSSSHAEQAGATFAKTTEQLQWEGNRLGTAVKFLRGSVGTPRLLPANINLPRFQVEWTSSTLKGYNPRRESGKLIGRGKK